MKELHHCHWENHKLLVHTAKGDLARSYYLEQLLKASAVTFLIPVLMTHVPTTKHTNKSMNLIVQAF